MLSKLDGCCYRPVHVLSHRSLAFFDVRRRPKSINALSAQRFFKECFAFWMIVAGRKQWVLRKDAQLDLTLVAEFCSQSQASIEAFEFYCCIYTFSE